MIKYNNTCHIKIATFEGNCDYNADKDHIEIVAGSSEDIYDYCANDWTVSHSGDYKNFDEALAAITKLNGEVRTEEEQNVVQSLDDNVLRTFKPGLLIKMSRAEAFDFVYNFMIDSMITHKTTDEELFELSEDCNIEAIDQGYKLTSDVKEWMTKHRDDLILDQNEISDFENE